VSVASVRSRLTAAYALALVGTMAVFGAALYVGRGANVYRELQRYVVAHAVIAVRALEQTAEGGDPVVETVDPLVGPQLTAEARRRLEVLPDYVFVLDASGRALYMSAAARRLETADLQTVLDAAAQRVQVGNYSLKLTLRRTEVLLAAQRPGSAVPVDRVVAGASTRTTTQSGRELIGTMLAVAPFVLMASVGAAYVIAGSAVAPLDRVINEVEAITDGRSLHRRLAVDGSGDELARLNATLNAMLGRLETSFGALRRFTADASHELRTPLTVLRADVERAMTASVPPSEQLVALEEALHETTRMADLVDSLLTLARADEGRFDLHRMPLDIEPVVHDVFETAVILGEEAGLHVNLTAAEPAIVLGDLTRLRQLFLNLITNAIKYTPRGGEVELRLARRGTDAAFAVRDTGIGIAAADLPYVFERFWRADRARSRAAERGGSGLGLAISQYIAQAHGGQLTVQSRLGRGSTFTVLIPLAPDEVLRELADVHDRDS
jgi:signal transduction histidine kinase